MHIKLGVLLMDNFKSCHTCKYRIKKLDCTTDYNYTTT